MRKLLEMEYMKVTSTVPNPNNVIRTSTQSLLDADFEEEEGSHDEIDCYISEKPVKKEIDILVWWKVNILALARHYLRSR